MILQFSIWKPVVYSSKENKWIIMRERERERDRERERERERQGRGELVP